ncbi:hypothetical protein BEL04_17915 [Mucilaginibacter sp. PPCGB 2223]|uniref:hypothetical protein n=1 Tax=Mucilaginibacter sp. PPCGB 2223 TaxID=1886027 RepID=UPI00082613EB|nr:hypothetical protein [Mucilaginibacter sp. PPCGB 2223]OCX51880.1 hypothetical protein BEL04_17915 [Mucilaginibacter sp. PPCGB 2223]
MKTLALILIHIATAVVLLMASCGGPAKAKMLKGEWKSKDGETVLKITGKQFTMNNDSPVPEDYFIKDDTIFTSFQGNQPYSRFVVVKLDDHQLKLMYPDSSLMEFSR